MEFVLFYAAGFTLSMLLKKPDTSAKITKELISVFGIGVVIPIAVLGGVAWLYRNGSSDGYNENIIPRGGNNRRSDGCSGLDYSTSYGYYDEDDDDDDVEITNNGSSNRDSSDNEEYSNEETDYIEDDEPSFHEMREAGYRDGYEDRGEDYKSWSDHEYRSSYMDGESDRRNEEDEN